MTAEDRTKALKELDVLRIVAVADFLLLLALLYASLVADSDGAVSVLGPIHGIGFLAMLYLTVKGSGEGHWGWWFPIAVLVTGGPIGSLVGDLKVRKDLRAAAPA